MSTNNITISGAKYANSAITTTSGTGLTSPYTVSTTAAYPWLGNGITSDANGVGKLRLDGNGADVVINGVSLADTIKRIEERLNILVTNTELEKEWEELRSLGEQYRKLEQHIKDKQATWDRLTAVPKSNVK